MVAFIQTSIVGVLIWMHANGSEKMMFAGLVITLIGNFGSVIAYENLKERIEKLERQKKKEDDIIKNKQYKINGRSEA